jgi:purine-binding chemotaxis protein CheW
VLNRGRGEARIESIYRSPDGRGLVSILKPERLFEDERVAQILADGRTRDAQGSHSSMTEAATERGEQFVVFRLGDEHYGLPVAAVDEIVRLPDSLTRVPNAPAFVEGVMNLRGKVVPVIDQRRRFQAPEAPGLKDRRRVIVTTFGALQAGFVVDRVTDILELTPDRMRETPELASEGDPVFDRVATAEADGQMILLVDPKALLDRAEADLLAAMAEVTPQS